jgi:hypothetical protein
MIFDPDGSFFVRKAFPEDVWKEYEQSKGQFLEPVFQLTLISEAFVIGSKYAQALGYGSETNLLFWIRWSGLRRRLLKGLLLLNGVYGWIITAPVPAATIKSSSTSCYRSIHPLKRISKRPRRRFSALLVPFGGYRFPEAIIRGQVAHHLGQLQ